VEDYLKIILESITKRVKLIPPIKRKEIDIKHILGTLNEVESVKNKTFLNH